MINRYATANCPRTPAPLRNASFLMSAAAILETPTLLKKSSPVSSSSGIGVATSGGHHELNPPSAASSAAMQFLMLNHQFQVAANNGSPFHAGNGANNARFSFPSPYVAPDGATTVASSVQNMQISSNTEGNLKRKMDDSNAKKAVKRVAFEPVPFKQNSNNTNWPKRTVPAITSGPSFKQPTKAPNEAAKKDPKQLRLITGSIEHILKMTKVAADGRSALLELYANVLSIKEGAYECEKVLLLRNRSGPVMQGVFYEIDFRMTAIVTGDLVRCVGRLSGGSRLQILKITPATPEDEQLGGRLQTVSSFAAAVKR
ncbi:uncharacterized protein LOC128733482 [Sabethes cyaneus]|uniref:uncharacterized protein LOC128733482 n=1 Tax=Sabethes cyaneus TaxID=53552 RepID=UPI00237E0FAE|nr:uncharacterized protein LOC128733482 [Sabethes cyaneus]